MDTTKLSSKGQVILPKSVRDANNWRPGAEFAVESVAEGVLLRPLKPFNATRLENVIGSTGYKGPAKKLADMDRAIARAIEQRRARGRY